MKFNITGIPYLFKEAKMPIKDDVINLAPSAIRLAIKMIRFSRGGFDAEEKKELGSDLLDLALLLLKELDEEA
jgi:hypothetical protein